MSFCPRRYLILPRISSQFIRVHYLVWRKLLARVFWIITYPFKLATRFFVSSRLESRFYSVGRKSLSKPNIRKLLLCTFPTSFCRYPGRPHQTVLAYSNMGLIFDVYVVSPTSVGK